MNGVCTAAIDQRDGWGGPATTASRAPLIDALMARSSAQGSEPAHPASPSSQWISGLMDSGRRR